VDPSALHFDSGRLEVRIGLATVPGPRADNQDFALAYLGTQATRASHGVVAAVADGVSSTTGGRVAAELAVRGFIDGFLAQKETLAVPQAAAIALTAIADWIESQGQRDANLAGMATTLAALVLRGRRAYGIHIGDSRLYRLTQGQLTQLTTDHHLNARVLSRAVGIEGGSRADYCSEPAAAGDRFLLTTDGVHSALSATRIGAILKRRAAPDETAEMLVTAALEAGGRDNATAMVVDVIDIPAADRADLAADMARLPIGSLPAPGETVDQFDLGPILADGEMSRLFRAMGLGSAKRRSPILAGKRGSMPSWPSMRGKRWTSVCSAGRASAWRKASPSASVWPRRPPFCIGRGSSIATSSPVTSFWHPRVRHG
jgi:serine/threonine protein phosphatase PrpC